MAFLLLVRHGSSDYNEKGLWTGWADPSLTEKGQDEAHRAGQSLKNVRIDYAFTSSLKRAKETLEEMQKTLGISVPVTEHEALNERNYGDYTGKNKWEIKEKLGEEEFLRIRRGWDHPIPNGESLKQVYERVVPYYKKEIEPLLVQGKNVIVVSSGNALRALVKYLEKIPDLEIPKLEIGTGETYCYTIDATGNVTHKDIKFANPNIP